MFSLALLGILLFGAWSYQLISGNLFGTAGKNVARATRPHLFWGVLTVEIVAIGWGMISIVQRLMTP